MPRLLPDTSRSGGEHILMNHQDMSIPNSGGFRGGAKGPWPPPLLGIAPTSETTVTKLVCRSRVKNPSFCVSAPKILHPPLPESTHGWNIVSGTAQTQTVGSIP